MIILTVGRLYYLCHKKDTRAYIYEDVDDWRKYHLGRRDLYIYVQAVNATQFIYLTFQSPFIYARIYEITKPLDEMNHLSHRPEAFDDHVSSFQSFAMMHLPLSIGEQ